MSGYKENITKDGRLWIDSYPDGSFRIIDDGENYLLDRVEIGFSKDEFMKIIAKYLKNQFDNEADK